MSYTAPKNVANATWVGAASYQPAKWRLKGSWVVSTAQEVFQPVYDGPPAVPAPVLKWTQFARPDGIPAFAVSNNLAVAHPDDYVRRQFVVNASWVGAKPYTAPKNIVNAAWTLPAEATQVSVTGWLSSTVGSSRIELNSRYVLPTGFASSSFGTARLTTSALGIFPVGIGSTAAYGVPFVADRIRYLRPAGLSTFLSGAQNIQNWVRYLLPDGGVHTAYGRPVLTRGVQQLGPTGFVATTYGSVSIENKKRFLNQIGWSSSIVAVGAKVWDGKQFIDKVTLGDGMFVPAPIVSVPVGPPDKTQYLELSGKSIDIPDNQVWPLHLIENRTKQAFAEGFTSYAVPSPRVEQTIYLTIRPLGAEWSVFGTAFVDQTIKKTYPQGFSSEFVSASHQIYNFRIDVVAGGLNSYASGNHTVMRGTSRPIVPGIAPKTVVATGARVEFRIRPVTPYGWDTSIWGSAIVRNRNVAVAPGGIAPLPQTGPESQWRIPKPTVWFRTRYLGPEGAGDIKPGTVPASHQLTHWIQYVDFAARGIPPAGIGTPYIDNRYRTIYPTFVASMVFGTATVKRRHYVDPVGWDSALVSENAEVVINTRRVYADSTPDDFSAIGNATIFNWIQHVNLDRNGWYDTQWNNPVVYNLKQEIKVGPFMDNGDPDLWGKYFPFVENKDRYLRAQGHSSSRVNIAGWIHNAAEPILPEGSEFTQWGRETFISHRNRTVGPEGWDSFYNDRYTVVWNLADVLAPVSLGRTDSYGRPTVENLNRTVKQHSGWLGPEWGLPFIAFGVRYIQPKVFYDVPASFPEVRLNPFPIKPVGIPWQGQVGAHEVRIFRREVFPFAVNVHSNPWFGEGIVRNRNVSFMPYGYEQTEFGVTDIQLFVRRVSPEGFSSTDVPKVLVSYRTRSMMASGMAPPTITSLHRIRNMLPDPPGSQRIDLSKMDPQGAPADGFGIPPPEFPSKHDILLRTAWPEGFASSRLGLPTIWSTTIEAKFFANNSEIGIPTLIFTQIVKPTSLDRNLLPFGTPRLTPHNIYAPLGSERPPGYTPGAAGHPIDGLRPIGSGDSAFPWFGYTTVTNQHRSIGPVPSRPGNELSGRT